MTQRLEIITTATSIQWSHIASRWHMLSYYIMACTMTLRCCHNPADKTRPCCSASFICKCCWDLDHIGHIDALLCMHMLRLARMAFELDTCMVVHAVFQANTSWEEGPPEVPQQWLLKLSSDSDHWKSGDSPFQSNCHLHLYTLQHDLQGISACQHSFQLLPTFKHHMRVNNP